MKATLALNKIKILFYLLLFTTSVQSQAQLDEKTFMQESEESLTFYEEYAKFYELPANKDLQDITKEVLDSSHVSQSQKENIQKHKRKIYVFSYPSDSLKVKGLISFAPNPSTHPIIVFLRGGNGIFGLLNPGSDLINPGEYTVISTMYRGGVSEGTDQFGGDDVEDVKNLIDFIPVLEDRLSFKIQNNKMFLMGRSRGGMELFLTLKRFPELQDRFAKVVSLSGVLDIRQWIASRPDIEEVFTNDFGYKKNVNSDEWINKRDPLRQYPILRNSCPFSSYKEQPTKEWLWQ